MRFPRKTTAAIIIATLLLGNLNVLNFENLEPKIVYASNQTNSASSTTKSKLDNKDKVVNKFKKLDENTNKLSDNILKNDKEKKTVKNSTGQATAKNLKEGNLAKPLTRTKVEPQGPKYTDSASGSNLEGETAVAGSDTVLVNDNASEKRTNDILENLKQTEEKLNEKIDEAPKEETSQPENTVNKDELNAEINKYESIVEKEEFNSASDEDKENYKTMIGKALETLADPESSQEGVNNTLSSLKEAEVKVTTKRMETFRQIFTEVIKSNQPLGYFLGEIVQEQKSPQQNVINYNLLNPKKQTPSVLANTGTTAVSTSLLGILIFGLAVILRKKVK